MSDCQHCELIRNHSDLQVIARRVSDVADELLVRLGPANCGLDGDRLAALLTRMDAMIGKTDKQRPAQDKADG